MEPPHLVHRNSFENRTPRFVPPPRIEAVRKSSFWPVLGRTSPDLLSRKSISIRPDGYNFDWLGGEGDIDRRLARLHSVFRPGGVPGLFLIGKVEASFPRGGKSFALILLVFYISALYIWVSESLFFLLVKECLFVIRKIVYIGRKERWKFEINSITIIYIESKIIYITRLYLSGIRDNGGKK